MHVPNPNGFKTHEKKLLSKDRSLRREIETYWNRKVPGAARTPIIWAVLQSLVDDLSERLPRDLAMALQSAIATRSLGSYIKLGAEWGNPQKYDFPGSYFAAASVLNLFKKLDVKVEGLDPRAKAVERFRTAEMRCGQANRRLKHYRKFDYSESRPLTKRLQVHEVFHLARRKIQQWLGPVNLGEILSNVRHGPGGCVGLKRPFTTPFFKFGEGNYTVTSGAYWLAVRAIVENDSWVRGLAQEQGLCGWDYDVSLIPYETKLRLADARITIADYNEVTFVNKDATTLRTIAIEGRLNVALQLAVGGIFKKKLKMAGCDLFNQTHNQQLARIGSIQHESQDPVTIDEEMASDTMCSELVQELLPEDWFEVLDALRSRTGRLDKESIEWEKFSSMGNGFTFELESMIFYALAQSVSDLSGTTTWFRDTFGPEFKYSYVSVFGDDIIVPRCISDHLVAILRFCGFRTNEKKSFFRGPFRESCGSDYYSGVPVRAFYFKRSFTLVRDLIHLHNGLMGLANLTAIRLPIGNTIRLVRGMIPKVLTDHLLGVRPTTGDEYLWVTPDTSHSSRFVSWSADHQSWVYPTMRQKLDVGRGSLIWRYVQFLYANRGNPDVDDFSDKEGTKVSHLDEEPFGDPHRFALAYHVSAGGSAGDIVLSGRGSGTLHLTG